MGWPQSMLLKSMTEIVRLTDPAFTRVTEDDEVRILEDENGQLQESVDLGSLILVKPTGAVYL